MCLKDIVKFVVLTFNLIFVLVGAALITIGTLYKINYNDVSKAIPDAYDHFELIPILTIVVGSIIFLISFFGCCGAIRNSSCLLTTYAVILLLIFILQVALGVFVFLEVKNEDDLGKNVNRTIDEVFTKYDKEKELVDFIQKELKCCGTYGPDFWIKNNTKIPPSCCKDENKNCNISESYTDGCRNEFFDFLMDSARIIGITVLTLAATEVIGATLSLCLANSIRNEIRRGGYYS